MVATTESFFELSPDRVLDAVEASGFRCTGRCFPLNSYENRVYEVELEEPRIPNDRLSQKCVVKFYRPGRWSLEAIQEEHLFLNDLVEAEIPAVAPIRFQDDKTVHRTQIGELYYTIFPKVGGRIPDEFSADQLRWLGRLLGRMHNTGALRKAPHRITLHPDQYGKDDLEFLLAGNWIPAQSRVRYETAAREIFEHSRRLFGEISPIRIHGDCHTRNLLWDVSGPFFLDFDDMMMGPPVQDFWMLLTETGSEGERQLDILLEGYELIRSFDRKTLRWIEPLRALRYVHYSAWLARRWEDPAFPLAFPHFNTPRYWEEKTNDLLEQLSLIREVCA